MKTKPAKSIKPKVKTPGKENTAKEVDNLPAKINYKVNREQALVMALKGETYETIGKYFGVSKQAISQLLKPHRDVIEAYMAFKTDPATVYEMKESMIINSLDSADIEKMSGYQKVGAGSLLRDKVRLERGQSTENVTHFHAVVRQLQREEQVIEPDNSQATPQS